MLVIRLCLVLNPKKNFKPFRNLDEGFKLILFLIGIAATLFFVGVLNEGLKGNRLRHPYSLPWARFGRAQPTLMVAPQHPTIKPLELKAAIHRAHFVEL